MRNLSLAALAVLLVAGTYKVEKEAKGPEDPGGLIVFRSERDGNPELYAMRPDGSGLERLTYNTVADEAPLISPDGTKIAYRTFHDGDFDLAVLDLMTRESVLLTQTITEVGEAGWSPDSEWLVYTADMGQESEVMMVRADGSETINVTRNVFGDSDASFSPDGSRIILESYRLLQDHLPGGETLTFSKEGYRDLFEVDVECLMTLDPSAQYDWEELSPEDQRITLSPEALCETRLTDDVDSNTMPSYSPDGKWIGYLSNRDGRRGELMIMDAVPGPDGSRRKGRVLDDFEFDEYNDFFDMAYDGPRGDHPYLQLGVTRYRWSPDGSGIALEATIFKRTPGDFPESWLGEIVGVYSLPKGVLTPMRASNTVGVDHHPRFSPDGQWIVFAGQGKYFRNEIYVRHLASGTEMRLTDNRVGDFEPDWTAGPDLR